MVSYSLCVDHILEKKKLIDFIDELRLQQENLLAPCALGSSPVIIKRKVKRKNH